MKDIFYVLIDEDGDYWTGEDFSYHFEDAEQRGNADFGDVDYDSDCADVYRFTVEML